MKKTTTTSISSCNTQVSTANPNLGHWVASLVNAVPVIRSTAQSSYLFCPNSDSLHGFPVPGIYSTFFFFSFLFFSFNFVFFLAKLGKAENLEEKSRARRRRSSSGVVRNLCHCFSPLPVWTQWPTFCTLQLLTLFTKL